MLLIMFELEGLATMSVVYSSTKLIMFELEGLATMNLKLAMLVDGCIYYGL